MRLGCGVDGSECLACRSSPIHEACCSFALYDSGGSFVGTVCAITCLGAWGVPRGTDSVDLLSVTRLCAPQRHTCSFS